ncbi:EAL domain-containing protein [Hyphomicrobium sp.]|uniref:EAL domain-containing protein n=1 Tax=Hyphomicrobium sp. TaxID=82 RepID=UPI002E2EC79F|nr:EAL domain-containing protein [Hyphomicrobium sp.]HEX2843545.1 EAL domain-containing protein [Hyphomicrobium sp.]
MTGNQKASQAVVVVAMGLVVGAGAVALYQHAGLPGPAAATAALSAYLLLLTVHAFIWRGGRGAFNPVKMLEKRSQPIRQKNEPRAAAPQSQPARNARPPSPLQAPPSPPEGRARAPINSQTPAPAMPPPLPARQAERHVPASLALPSNPQAPARNADADADDLDDFWSFRPAATQDKKLPPFVTGRAGGRAPEPTVPSPAPARAATAPANSHQMPPARPAPAPHQSSAPREADVEVIQDAIKRLLEEVNAAEQQEARAQQATANGIAPPPLPARGPNTPESSVDRSIDALRMTAGSMRSALGEHEAAAPRNAAPPPLPPFVRGPHQARATSPSDARARLMADAISAGRIDVALEPILGLEDQQTRHYEVSVRLRDADGNPLDVDGGPDLRGTGLLPLFDGVRITRTAAVARRLDERGKGGSVFSAFSGESIADEHFLGELAETLHQRSSLASQLVLSFTQTDVRGFSTPEWDSLADMRSLGFRFALSAITDLDMDFEALAEQGFAFVKLDATVFLEGLPAPSGRIPSNDVCRHLAQHGLTLVVDHIESDDQLARVFGFGVLLGQGQLFGGARPVRADVVATRARATVAAE